MALDAETRAAVDRARREREAMTPEECLKTAAFTRECAKRLPTERQRQLAEDMAVQLERQAAAQVSGPSV